ncbi:CDGSH iron-sulfur domain-containing protein [Streptomyces sp. URMC 123]|uniref:CDGSH iron-sulfur domain-containing protein n=1 Tax=Streptomyces sp. URMC 123 TaxID=3423403 RepID=UPI003F1C0491
MPTARRPDDGPPETFEGTFEETRAQESPHEEREGREGREGWSGERGERPRRVRIDPGGPLVIDGPVEVVLPDGSTVASDRFAVAVCVCRRSRVYPWCDASHRRRQQADGARSASESASDGPQSRGRSSEDSPRSQAPIT